MTTLIILTLKLKMLLSLDSIASLSPATRDAYAAGVFVIVILIAIRMVVNTDKKPQKKA